MPETIKGLDKILAKLKKLDSKHNVRIHKAATRAGATALRKGAEARLGQKKKLGISQSRTFSRGDLIVFKIGPYKDHWALAFQEFGAPGHWIETVKKGKGVSAEGPRQAMKIGENFIRGKHWHPGVRKTKFLSRSLTEDDKKAFDAIGKRYWSRINKLL